MPSIPLLGAPPPVPPSPDPLPPDHFWKPPRASFLGGSLGGKILTKLCPGHAFLAPLPLQTPFSSAHPKAQKHCPCHTFPLILTLTGPLAPALPKASSPLDHNKRQWKAAHFSCFSFFWTSCMWLAIGLIRSAHQATLPLRGCPGRLSLNNYGATLLLCRGSLRSEYPVPAAFVAFISLAGVHR